MQKFTAFARQTVFSWELAAAVLIYGLVVGIGLGAPLLVVAVVAPYGLMLLLSKPEWIAPFYVSIVFADLLSIATKEFGVPPLARFAGALLLVAVLGYRVVVLKKWLPPDVMTWWMMAYGLLLAAGLLYARNTDNVSSNLIEFARSLITYLIIICVLINRARLRIVLWGLLTVAVIIGLISVYQSLTGNFDNDFYGLAQSRVSDISGDTEGARPGGSIGDANYYGQWLLLVLPLGFFLLFEGKHPIHRVAGLFSSAVIGAAVVLTYSRGDALALMVMIGAIVIYKKPKPIVIAAAIIVAGISLPFLPGNYVARLSTVVATAQGSQDTIYGEESIRGRLGAATAGVDMFLDHPIIGVGRENYQLYQLEYLAGTSLALRAKSIPPHDLYLEIAAEQGLLGLFVFAGIILAAFAAIVETRHRLIKAGDKEHAELAAWLGISLIGWLVCSLFLHGAYLYFLWLLLALIIALRQIARTTPVAPPPVAKSRRRFLRRPVL